MDSTLKKAETRVVDTAILLASSGVFTLGESQAKGSEGALTRVGGLTLFQRTILTLQRGGISQVLILVGEEERTLRSLVQEDSRIQAALRWLPIREFPPANPQTWETLAGEVKGSCMVIGCHTVFSPTLVQMLRIGGGDGRVLVVVGRPGEGSYGGNPGVALKDDFQPGVSYPGVMFHDPSHALLRQEEQKKENFSVAGDLVVLPARLLGVSGVLNAPGSNPIRLALEQAAIEGVVQTVPGSPHQFRDIRVPNGPRLAEHTLIQSIQSLKGGLDGFVDRYINRKFSRYFTQVFLKFGISPNAITLLSMGVGLVAAGLFASGSYQWGVIGALLFQLSVIIDCCDGEVARLTFAESQFGQELDIWADNVVHMSIFAGIACGSYFHGPWQYTNLPIILGAFAISANAVSLWLVNRARHLRSRPREFRRLTETERTRMNFILGNVANRDFSVVVLLFAGLDILRWFLWLAAAGSWFFVLTMGWILRRTLLRRA